MTSPIFYLPHKNNSITRADIDKGVLRITVDAKIYFPDQDTEVKVIVNGLSKSVAYRKKNQRSDLLYVGKDIMTKLSVRNRTRLKFTRLSTHEFLIENDSFLFASSETDEINFEQLLNLKKKYWQTLKDNPFPKPPQSGQSLEMIRYFKRKIEGENISIGPYTGITVFEAANRIASDLVIINVVLQLIETKKEPKDSKITIRLGNRHDKGKGDFTINGKDGEAFNVAVSFYKVKLMTTNKKWILGGLHYILVNADAFDEIKSNDVDAKIIKIENWDKE